MMPFRLIRIFCSMAVLLSCYLSPSFGEKSDVTPAENDEGIQRAVRQEQLIQEGSTLVEKGLYEEAIKKYEEALTPAVLNSEQDKGNAIYYIGKVYKLQGKYEVSLKELQWSINQNPNGTGWSDEKFELEALIKTRDTKSPEPIYDYVAYLQKKYADILPPNNWTTYSQFSIVRIIRLYDHIGDYDAGIKFIDENVAQIHKWKAKNRPKDINNVGRGEAEYLKIRTEFEQEKQDGWKGCIEAKPGDACMGRATKALIQSDYFPW